MVPLHALCLLLLVQMSSSFCGSCKQCQLLHRNILQVEPLVLLTWAMRQFRGLWAGSLEPHPGGVGGITFPCQCVLGVITTEAASGSGPEVPERSGVQAGSGSGGGRLGSWNEDRQRGVPRANWRGDRAKLRGSGRRESETG